MQPDPRPGSNPCSPGLEFDFGFTQIQLNPYYCKIKNQLYYPHNNQPHAHPGLNLTLGSHKYHSTHTIVKSKNQLYYPHNNQTHAHPGLNLTLGSHKYHSTHIIVKSKINFTTQIVKNYLGLSIHAKTVEHI